LLGARSAYNFDGGSSNNLLKLVDMQQKPINLSKENKMDQCNF